MKRERETDLKIMMIITAITTLRNDLEELYILYFTTAMKG